jgi:hypothetical protein
MASLSFSLSLALSIHPALFRSLLMGYRSPLILVVNAQDVFFIISQELQGLAATLADITNIIVVILKVMTLSIYYFYMASSLSKLKQLVI